MESRVIDNFPEWAEGAVLLQGFDDALIGFGSQWGGEPCAIYSVRKIMEILEQDMEVRDAIEFYYHNIACIGVGSQTPIMLEDRDTLGPTNYTRR